MGRPSALPGSASPPGVPGAGGQGRGSPWAATVLPPLCSGHTKSGSGGKDLRAPEAKPACVAIPGTQAALAGSQEARRQFPLTSQLPVVQPGWRSLLGISNGSWLTRRQRAASRARAPRKVAGRNARTHCPEHTAVSRVPRRRRQEMTIEKATSRDPGDLVAEPVMAGD